MWDGDPVSLNPLPARESGRRIVDLIGADAILAEGRRAFDAGDYRWAVEILHKLVFAEPGSTTARELQADAYEQLGYQAEGPQWRGIYLTAARELREGVIPATFASASPDTILSMPIDILFDYAAVHIVGPMAAAADIRIAFRFTDPDESWRMWIANGVLNARRGTAVDAALTLSGPKGALVAAILEPRKAGALLDAGHMTAEGDRSVLDAYAALIDEFDRDFPMVTPIPPPSA